MREIIKKTIRKLFGAENARKLGQAVRPKKIKWTVPPPDGKVRLNLGCGDKILQGYINVDFAESRKGNKPDIISDLRALEFAHDYADEILSVHVIEHFYPWEAKDLLLHWKDILKPGGRLVLECPNILTAAEMLLKDPDRAARADGKDGQLAMWPLYGDPAWKDPLMCHRWGYTPTPLIDLLNHCGFSNVRREPALFKQQDPRDMRVVGEK
jgi:SAM-dependent methyltransferase